MKILEQVESILKCVPKTRDSDKELMIVFMAKSGMNLTQMQESVFRKMASMETIRRSRQIIQEQGKYPASPEVEQERYNKFITVKQGIHYEDPEKLLEKQGYTVLPYGE